MRGFWADEKVDNGQWNLKNPVFKTIYQYYKRKEFAFLLHADAIVSLTEAGRNELIKQKNYSKLFIDVIPCCADLDHFNFHLINEETRVKVAKELGIRPDKKVITYLGSIGGWYMTNEMFDFFKRLLIKDSRFVMLIITKDDAAQVKNEAALRGAPTDKIVVISSNRNDLPAYLSVSDYSIFFICPTYSKIASSPTKHAELMGMGIPVICNNIGDTGKIISETNTGKIIQDFNQTEYDRIIEEMPELLGINKQYIRDAAFRYFDLVQGANKYRNIYQRLLT
jgi:glycosyltransferase involved in cell wall biosynthesis